jgi:hypothetical protein
LLRLIESKLQKLICEGSEQAKLVNAEPNHDEAEEKKKIETPIPIFSPPQSAFSRISFRSGELRPEPDRPRLIQQHLHPETQTPTPGPSGIFISPIPLGMTPGFSPFGDVGHGIFFAHKTPRPEGNNMVRPDYFSYDFFRQLNQ